MSCWFLGKEDIDAIVYGAREWGGEFLRLTNHDTGMKVNARFAPSAIGESLWRYNLDAYCDRYPDESRDYELCRYTYPNDLKDGRKRYEIGEVYGALCCYEYQCSDEHTWERYDNEFRGFCKGLKDNIVMALFRMHGHEVPYGIGGHDMAETRL